MITKLVAYLTIQTVGFENRDHVHEDIRVI